VVHCKWSWGNLHPEVGRIRENNRLLQTMFFNILKSKLAAVQPLKVVVHHKKILSIPENFKKPMGVSLPVV